MSSTFKVNMYTLIIYLETLSNISNGHKEKLFQLLTTIDFWFFFYFSLLLCKTTNTQTEASYFTQMDGLILLPVYRDSANGIGIELWFNLPQKTWTQTLNRDWIQTCSPAHLMNFNPVFSWEWLSLFEDWLPTSHILPCSTHTQTYTHSHTHKPVWYISGTNCSICGLFSVARFLTPSLAVVLSRWTRVFWLLLFFNCLLSPVSLNLENSSCAIHGGGYGRFSLRFYARCALIWRRRVSPPLCHSFHFTCEEGGRLEKGLVGWGEKREGGGPSLSRRVSWLLCIQQQLWANAWTHGGTAPSGTACSDHSSLGAGFFFPCSRTKLPTRV